jgi:hypothetical protein
MTIVPAAAALTTEVATREAVAVGTMTRTAAGETGTYIPRCDMP